MSTAKVLILILPFLLLAEAQNAICDGSSICRSQPPQPSWIGSRIPPVAFSPMNIPSNQLRGYSCNRPNGYFPVSSRCDAYVECRNNTAFEYMCPNGHYYSPNAQWPSSPCAINYPAQNGMCGRPPMRRPQMQPGYGDMARPPMFPVAPSQMLSNQLRGYNCNQPNGYYPVSSSCNSFVECRRNAAVQFDCPNGLHYNPNAQWPNFPCTHPSEVNCQTRMGTQNSRPAPMCPRSYGFFPASDSSDCGKYIMCQGGRPTVRNCPNGLAFDLDRSTCDFPINVPRCMSNNF